MKKILVFGSNGLVGKSLKRKLENEYEPKNLFFSNRNDTDLFSYEETRKTIDTFEPDVLINAAAKVGGIYANNLQRTEFLIENLKINLNILESCIEHKNTLIINLGSSCIYPLNAPNPIKESSIMTGALEPTNSPYAMAKLTSIELANSLNIRFGHTVVNLMPTNLYGPEDNFSDMDSHVIPGLMNKMHRAKEKNEKTFEIWGSGKPKREIIFVDDIADACLFFMKRKTRHSLINIGTGRDATIEDYAKKIINYFNVNLKIIKNTKMPDGIKRKLLNIKIAKSYGWKPKINFARGLDLTVKAFLKSNL